MTTITEEATEAAVSAVNEYIAAQSAADPDFDAGDFYTPAHRQGLAGHVCATILAAQARDSEPRCIACDQALKAGELVLDDASGGIIHRECCGPEREAYTSEDGAPLKDGEPIPTGWAWEPDPRPSAPQAEGRDTGLREALAAADNLIQFWRDYRELPYDEFHEKYKMETATSSLRMSELALRYAEARALCNPKEPENG